MRMRMPKYPRKNPYKHWYDRLVNFSTTAELDPVLCARNEYLRTENMLLRGMFFQRHERLNLSCDEKEYLAEAAVKVRGRTKAKVSLLTPAQIVRYSQSAAGKKYVSLFPKRKCIKRETHESVEKILIGIVEEHPRWRKKEIFKEMQKYFPNITYKQVYDRLYDMGYWDCKPPKKGLPWKEFLARFENVTWAGDFFSVDIWTDHGQVTYYVLFFIHLATHRVVIGGISPHATSEWLTNILRSWSGWGGPFGDDARFLIRDRDRRYTPEVDWYFMQMGMLPKVIAPGAPVMNCFAEQFVRKIKHECLSMCIFLSEKGFKNVIDRYLDYYHRHRPNSKFDGGFIEREKKNIIAEGQIVRTETIPGVLSYYTREEKVQE